MFMKGIKAMLRDDTFWAYIVITLLFCLFVFFAEF